MTYQKYWTSLAYLLQHGWIPEILHDGRGHIIGECYYRPSKNGKGEEIAFGIERNNKLYNTENQWELWKKLRLNDDDVGEISAFQTIDIFEGWESHFHAFRELVKNMWETQKKLDLTQHLFE